MKPKLATKSVSCLDLTKVSNTSIERILTHNESKETSFKKGIYHFRLCQRFG